MHLLISQLRNLITPTLAVAMLLCLILQNAVGQAVTPSSVAVIQDADGNDSFASVDNGPANLSLAIAAKEKTVSSVRLINNNERLTQQVGPDGEEQLIYERRAGSTNQRLEYVVNRRDDTVELRSASVSQAPGVAAENKLTEGSEKAAVACGPETSIDTMEQTAFVIDGKARGQMLEASKAIVDCGPSTARIAALAGKLMSSEAKQTNSLLFCAQKHTKFRGAVSSAMAGLALPQANLIKCSAESVSDRSPAGIELGKDLIGEQNDVTLERGLMKLLLLTSDKISPRDALDLSRCCSSANDQQSCKALSYFSGSSSENSAIVDSIARFALRNGKSEADIKKFINKARVLERTQKRDPTPAEKEKFVGRIINLCEAELNLTNCKDAFNHEGVSANFFKPTRAQVAAISATSKLTAQSPAQQPGAKPGTTTPTPALPQLNQRITYQRNDPASVRQALKKYEYMGPLAAAARKTADSISAQVSNVAVAATDGPSGASSEGFSYQSEPVEFKTGGGSISRIQVGNRSVYVKSTIPFGNRVGEPQTSVGSSPENLQPVSNTSARAKTQDPKRAAAATTGSSSAALDSTGGGGSQEPLSSGGGVGPSAQTPSARTGAGSRSVSSAQQSRFKSVTEFNTALVNEKNPRQFLSQSTETLRELKLQIVLKGESFPRNPDYNPRIYDFDELKRMMKR